MAKNARQSALFPHDIALLYAPVKCMRSPKTNPVMVIFLLLLLSQIHVVS